MKGIIIHCSASTFGNAQIIEDWHKEGNNWSDIGYHFTILNGQIENNHNFKVMDGQIECGRDFDKSGAHAKGYNDYIGICLIGNTEFTTAQFNSLATLIRELMDTYNIPPDKVLGHYQVSSKTCPNFDVDNFIYKYGLDKRD